MLEKTALGKRPIFGRALLAVPVGAPDVKPRMIALILPNDAPNNAPNDAMNESVAIRQQGEAI